jgi:hypothetical protein
MTRETRADRVRESYWGAVVQNLWQCRVVSYPRLSPVDWRLERDGGPFGVAELKHHNGPLFGEEFVGFLISEQKVADVAKRAADVGVPGYLFGGFDDGVGYSTRIDRSRVVLRKWMPRPGEAPEWCIWLAWDTWRPISEGDI